MWQPCTRTGCGPPCRKIIDVVDETGEDETPLDAAEERGHDESPLDAAEEIEFGRDIGFRRTRFGRIVGHFGEQERDLLVNLVGQLAEFIAPDQGDADEDPLARLVGIDQHSEVPEDPALLRLLPDAYPDDPDASAEFRRFTERGLRESKLANATVVLETLRHSGEKITLSAPQAAAWLSSLTDLRLTLGHRLGIVTDDDHDWWDEDPEVDEGTNSLRFVYQWLSWIQESLVQALMPS